MDERTSHMRVEDFEEIASRAPETVTLEFLDGRITEKAAPDGNRSTILAWLTRRFLRARPELWLQSAPRVKVGGLRRARARPDGALTPAKSLVEQGPWADPDSVLLVAEVTSYDADTDKQDRVEKPRAYAEALIPVYLLIDRDAGEVIVHSEPDGVRTSAWRVSRSGRTSSCPTPSASPWKPSSSRNGRAEGAYAAGMPHRGSPHPAPEAPAREWVAHDEAVRRDTYRLPARPEDPALALCHGNGRVREAALRGPGVPRALLPLVVVRCADWAGPVREAAREVLDRSGAGELAAVAHVVLRLAGRRHGGYAAELLAARLDEDPGVREAALRHSAREVRRWAWRRAEERWGLPTERFAEGALRDPDVLVQVRCAEAALRAGAPVPPDVLDRLLTARGARVRAVAVTALRRHGEPGRARGWLDDRSSHVRACAQWAVRQAGEDPLPHYREALEHPAAPPSAVAGLGECGGAEDVPVVLACLDDPRPAVRGAAVGALRALGGVSVARVLPLLDDPSPGVVRRAVEALLPEAGSLPEAVLVARAAPGREPRARRYALRLLDARGGLAPLRVALRQAHDPDTGPHARTVVRRWTPRDAGALVAALPPSERAALNAEITRAGPALTPYTVRYLRWITGLRDA
ncbi:hypothetical protein GCM10009801_45110 [Streptomyces albiaxialis]|uniref:Putative restriction endonuclease domain-containing protein n=1 Tax=Streptomyces albiaxialis TaxID=329523 RepID=A0ABP5HSP3_9ACTN